LSPRLREMHSRWRQRFGLWCGTMTESATGGKGLLFFEDRSELAAALGMLGLILAVLSCLRVIPMPQCNAPRKLVIFGSRLGAQRRDILARWSPRVLSSQRSSGRLLPGAAVGRRNDFSWGRLDGPGLPMSEVSVLWRCCGLGNLVLCAGRPMSSMVANTVRVGGL